MALESTKNLKLRHKFTVHNIILKYPNQFALHSFRKKYASVSVVIEIAISFHFLYCSKRKGNSFRKENETTGVLPYRIRRQAA